LHDYYHIDVLHHSYYIIPLAIRPLHSFPTRRSSDLGESNTPPTSLDSVSAIAAASEPAKTKTKTVFSTGKRGLAAKPTTAASATAAFASTLALPRAPSLSSATPRSSFRS